MIPLLGECFRNPSVSVYHPVLLWEAAFGFTEFILKNFSTRLPISWWVIYEHTGLHHTEHSAVFDQKWYDPVPHPLYLFTWSHLNQLFLVSLDERSPQRKTFCRHGRGEMKNGRNVKRQQQVQKLFWALEKASWWVYCIKWRILKVTEV